MILVCHATYVARPMRAIKPKPPGARRYAHMTPCRKGGEGGAMQLAIADRGHDVVWLSGRPQPFP